MKDSAYQRHGIMALIRRKLTILLGTGINDARACVGKFGQFHAIFFAQQALVVSTVLHIVDLNSLVALRGHAELAGIVKVDRQDIWSGFPVLDVVSLKELAKVSRKEEQITGCSHLRWSIRRDYIADGCCARNIGSQCP